MPRLDTCKESALDADTLAALEPVRMRGRLADVYLQFANSQAALRAYLHMENSLQASTLGLDEIESIKLLVSQLTGCEHCLSVHSFKGRQAGLSAEFMLALRRGEPLTDPALGASARLVAIERMVRTLFSTPGRLDDDVLAQAREAGLSDGELVDISMAMATIFFTNITNHINDSVSSLPPAPALGNV